MEPSTSSGRKRTTNTNYNIHDSKIRRGIVTGSYDCESTITSWLKYEDSSGSEAEDLEDTFIPAQHGSDENSQSDLQFKEEVEEDLSENVLLPPLRSSYGKNRYQWAHPPPSKSVGTDSSSSEAENLQAKFISEQHGPDEDSQSDLQFKEEVEEDLSEEILLSSLRSYYGKNRYQWAHQPSSNLVRTTQQHIIRCTNPSNFTVNDPKDPYSIWKNFMDDEMLQEILKWTNEKIKQYKTKFLRDDRSELKDLDTIELQAFIGLLYFTAAFKSSHENVDYIFATDGTGRDIFRCVMSKNRFLFILHCIRFDNPSDRKERKQYNKIAAISNLFTKFVANCQKVYNISEWATVDEMLVPFRGRTNLLVYMPLKPKRYGLKLMCLCDAKNGYLYNSYIYTGHESDGESLTDDKKKFLIPMQSVIRLTKPLHGSNRNITVNNWFTSVELVDNLKKKGLTCVGKLKKNNREIPKEFLPSKQRKVGSTLYGFAGEITLISHVSKKNKAVILLSSMHHAKAIDELTGKPEIIHFYNTTKGGVDVTDTKCSNYTCSRRTQRWPMAIFYRILDISSVNSRILYDIHQEKNTERGFFIKELARSLVLPHIKRRALNLKLPRELRLCLTRILGPDMPTSNQSEVPEVEQEDLKLRRRCHICPIKLQRKSTHTCFMCKKHVCLQCAKKVCPDCV